MRRKRPYTEPDRIKERIKVARDRHAMAECIKERGDILFNPMSVYSEFRQRHTL